MIRFERVCYNYVHCGGTVQAVRNIDLEIGTGEFVVIVGPNGSGKSTLARLANGLLVPSSGRVTVDGMDTSIPEFLFRIREKVGLVFQNPENQIVATIVENDVAFAPENLGLEPEEIRARVSFALRAVGLEEKRKAISATLSGGQKQRLAIAGVLAMKPAHIILDEPTAMLDGKGEKDVLDVLDYLNREEKVSVVIITHSTKLITRARRVVVLEDGAIVFDGTPEELFEARDRIASAGLELPPVLVLKDELEKTGVPVPRSVFDIEGLVEHLWKNLCYSGSKM